MSETMQTETATQAPPQQKMRDADDRHPPPTAPRPAAGEKPSRATQLREAIIAYMTERGSPIDDGKRKDIVDFVTKLEELAEKDAKVLSLPPKTIAAYLDLCWAYEISPLSKALHLVPFHNRKTGKTNVTMLEGIDLYRVIAERSGTYLGLADIELAEETVKLGDYQAYGKTVHRDFDVPTWARAKLKRRLDGETHIVVGPKVFATEEDMKQGQWDTRPIRQLQIRAEKAALKTISTECSAKVEDVMGQFRDHLGEPSDADTAAIPAPAATLARSELLARIARAEDQSAMDEIATAVAASDDLTPADKEELREAFKARRNAMKGE